MLLHLRLAPALQLHCTVTAIWVDLVTGAVVSQGSGSSRFVCVEGEGGEGRHDSTQ